MNLVCRSLNLVKPEGHLRGFDSPFGGDNVNIAVYYSYRINV